MPPVRRSGGRTAVALRRLAHQHDGPRLAVDDLLAALDDRGFGLLLLTLALPNLVPGPLIPGFSVPFALGIAALGLQLMRGFAAPRLPAWLRRRSVTLAGFRRFVDRAAPGIARVENLLRPRPSALTGALGERVTGATLIGLSAVLALPVPLGNLPVALSISIIALGLLESDGIALLWGVGGGLLAVLWNMAVVFAGAALADLLIAHLR